MVRNLKLQEPWPLRRLGEVTLKRKRYHEPSDENPADERGAKARARSIRILAFPRQRESQAEEIRMRSGGHVQKAKADSAAFPRHGEEFGSQFSSQAHWLVFDVLPTEA